MQEGIEQAEDAGAPSVEKDTDNTSDNNRKNINVNYPSFNMINNNNVKMITVVSDSNTNNSNLTNDENSSNVLQRIALNLQSLKPCIIPIPNVFHGLYGRLLCIATPYAG